MEAHYRAHELQGGLHWLRPAPGRVSLEDRHVVVSPTDATPYLPAEESESYDLLVDLVNLADAPPNGMVEFTRKWGLLLERGERATTRTPVHAIRSASERLNVGLQLYLALADLRAGDVQVSELRDKWAGLLVVFADEAERPLDDAEVVEAIARTLAALVNEGLQGAAATLGIESSADGDFSSTVVPRHLLGQAFVELYDLLVAGEPARRCDGCGRLYVQLDPRQRYHSTTCSYNTRRRRMRQKEATRG
jgi:hypothetical protein